MKSIRQTLAVLALACIAPLAQAFTLSVAPGSVQVGDSVVLQLDGSLTDIFQLDIVVSFDPSLVAVGSGALLPPPSTDVDPAAILDSGVSGAGGAFGLGGVIAAGSFDISYIADPVDPLNVTNGRIISIPFLANAAGVASFSIEICAMGANDTCDRGNGGTVTPVTLGTRLTITNPTTNRTPEPGSLALLGAVLLSAAGFARARRR